MLGQTPCGSRFPGTDATPGIPEEAERSSAHRPSEAMDESRGVGALAMLRGCDRQVGTLRAGGAGPQRLSGFLLLQEPQQVLGQLVGLGEHRHARLGENLEGGEAGHLGGEIDVEQGRSRGVQILDRGGEIRLGEFEP